MSRPSSAAQYQFGLFLNMGAQLAPRPEDIFAFTLEQAELAEDLGYHDLWVTEHHFIPFGINPSALTAAGFLLGRTRRVRVGTAVVLSPLYHPVQLAERATLLDQMSGGRLDLGVGRGGYLREYEVFGLDTGRWDDEPEATLRVLTDLWAEGSVASDVPWFAFDEVRVEPAARTAKPPALFAATSSEKGLAFAARHGIPIQHYFAMPLQARVAVEQRYEALRPKDVTAPEHLHTLIALVADDEAAARQQLLASLTVSFRAGNWPMVPQAPKNRHVDENGDPVDPAKMAGMAAAGALVGPPDRLAEQLGQFIEATGARRLAFFMESIGDRELTLASIERFAKEVRPLLTA